MYRAIAFVLACSILLVIRQAAVAADLPTGPGEGDSRRSTPVISDDISPAAPAQLSGDAKIDFSALKSPAWKAAIEKATNYPTLRAGGSVSLLRVLSGDEPAPEMSPSDEPVVVNGVRLYLPGLIDPIELGVSFPTPSPSPPRNVAKVQLESTKLVRFDQFPNGGGMYQETPFGEFILVEHINSTRRQAGRDPVTIGTFEHQRVQLGVPVPPKGQLGIVGDVVLSKTPREQLGRIVAELVETSDASVHARQFRIGPVVVGGPYGRTFDFNDHGFCSTDRLTPGRYRILMPDFDMAKSRWEADVKPGEVTYLRFSAASQNDLRLDHEKHLSFTE